VAPVRKDLMIGLAGQVTLLVVLVMTVDLSAAGWLTGLGYGLVMCALLARAMHRAGADAFGPADWVTQVRATLVGATTALTVQSIHQSSMHRPAAILALVAITSVALILDAVDGQVARRTGTESALGARFDMEVDAFLILVLSLFVARSMGPWVLAIGLMRYAYVVASWGASWLRDPLPARYWRKVVAATQGIVLVVAVSGAVPAGVMMAGVAVSLALLVESFGRDVWWQWRHRPMAFRPAADLRPLWTGRLRNEG
jgi:phosphatidylglycerophosphate synthase